MAGDATAIRRHGAAGLTIASGKLSRNAMSTIASALKTLKTCGLSLLPGIQPKSPWPGHDDVAVNNKSFAFMNVEGGVLMMSAKLPVTSKEALRLPFAAYTGYGLGKSGWVTFSFAGGEPIPIETAKRWVMESYRAQAPKRLVNELEAQQPWIKAGALPDA